MSLLFYLRTTTFGDSTNPSNNPIVRTNYVNNYVVLSELVKRIPGLPDRSPPCVICILGWLLITLMNKNVIRCRLIHCREGKCGWGEGVGWCTPGLGRKKTDVRDLTVEVDKDIEGLRGEKFTGSLDEVTYCRSVFWSRSVRVDRILETGFVCSEHFLILVLKHGCSNRLQFFRLV